MLRSPQAAEQLRADLEAARGVVQAAQGPSFEGGQRRSQTRIRQLFLISFDFYQL